MSLCRRTIGKLFTRDILAATNVDGLVAVSKQSVPAQGILRYEGISWFGKNNKIFHITNQSFSSSSFSTNPEGRKHSILTHALRHVHDEGWTGEAIALGTLDAGFPPSYIGKASSPSPPFGSHDLVAFFMDECNDILRKKLRESAERELDLPDTASKINFALRTRLEMVLPFVSSQRWHEGMAIGALPQNAYRTAQQLDEMAVIVLEFIGGKDRPDFTSPAQRAAIVAVYAAAEFHLLSGRNDETKQFNVTWDFLSSRSAEAAQLIEGQISSQKLGGMLVFNSAHVTAALSAASSLTGAVLSLAAPSLASLAGDALPRAASLLIPVQDAIAERLPDSNSKIRASDYRGSTLPPFDSSEVIFQGNENK